MNAERAAPGVPARAAALAILGEILRKRRALDVAASAILESSGLSARDAAFARAIASETMRRFGVLEALVGHFVAKPPPPHRAGPAMEILVAGACELLFLDVAPHAAVDAANRLAAADSKAVHYKSLINAALRRIAREGAGVLAGLDRQRLSLPDWLWTRWCAHYGERAARAIAAAQLARPALDLTLKTADDPYTDLPGGVRLAPGHVRLRDAGRIEDLPGYADGRWWVQDFAAALPARLFGDVRGKRVLDLCAAPGGKTAQLAAMGAQVTALDVAKVRLEIVKANLERLGLEAGLIAADARDWRPKERFPFVLLDAPCTATGTIRRHPELPWIKSAADIPANASLQRELLDAAAGMTAPGGTLLYAVCSLEPEEGIEQVESFLAAHSEFARFPLIPSDLPDPQFRTPDGDLRTLPSYWADKGGMDGFYAARLQRKR